MVLKMRNKLMSFGLEKFENIQKVDGTTNLLRY